MARRVIMGSEGPMGQLVFTCSVVRYTERKVSDSRLISIRTTPVNAALATLGWLNENCEWDTNSVDLGDVYVKDGDAVLWTIAIWDTTSMGEERHAQIGSVSSAGKPDLSHAKTLSDMAEKYLDGIGQ